MFDLFIFLIFVIYTTTINIMARTKATASRKPAAAESARWTTERDTFLVNQLLERAATGGRIDGNFTKEAWALTVKEFNAKFNVNYDLQQLKNRIIAASNILLLRCHNHASGTDYLILLQLRNRWRTMDDLVSNHGTSGWGYSARTNMVTARDEVWDLYLIVSTRHPVKLAIIDRC